jgi:uncharacterized membrane protein YhaH (DUF805 family)
MEFGEAISSGFRNYVTFQGRASRSEYWFWVLFAFLLGIVTATFDYFVFPGSDLSPTNTLTGLALFLPGLAVAARRLHDIDRTAWWLLLALTLIGTILLVIWACFKGTLGPNRFGPDPLAGEAMLART